MHAGSNLNFAWPLQAELMKHQEFEKLAALELEGLIDLTPELAK